MIPGRAPLLGQFHVAEDMPEIEFRKNSAAAKIDVWKPLVCREHAPWTQKPDRAA